MAVLKYDEIFVLCDYKSDRNLSWPITAIIKTLENGGEYWRIVNNDFIKIPAPLAVPVVPVAGLEPLGFAAPYVLLSNGNITNPISGQVISGDTGHIGNITNPFSYIVGRDVPKENIGSPILSNTALGDQRIATNYFNALIPNFNYAPGDIDLSSNLTTPGEYGTATPYVILCGTTLTNGVHNQLVDRKSVV